MSKLFEIHRLLCQKAINILQQYKYRKIVHRRVNLKRLSDIHCLNINIMNRSISQDLEKTFKVKLILIS